MSQDCLIWGKTSSHVVSRSEVCCVKTKRTHREQRGKKKELGFSLTGGGKLRFSLFKLVPGQL